DDNAARRYQRRAARLTARLCMPPPEGYFEALGAFYEQGGDLEGALRLRDGELKTIGDRGRQAYECAVRTERCRLLGLLGRLAADDLADARAAAGRLRDPAPCLAALEQIARGG